MKNGYRMEFRHWAVKMIPPDGSYGVQNSLRNETSKVLVEFYWLDAKKEAFPNGQFVSRYYMETLLTSDWTGLSLSEMADQDIGFSLDMDVKTWTIAPDELKEIADYLEAWKKEYEEHSVQPKFCLNVSKTEKMQETEQKERGLEP